MVFQHPGCALNAASDSLLVMELVEPHKGTQKSPYTGCFRFLCLCHTEREGTNKKDQYESCCYETKTGVRDRNQTEEKSAEATKVSRDISDVALNSLL